ncbi:MAG: hypothetical protein GY871_04460 [Actinomycetales bacterium]|nr:hypothetical protein [Actinomycetales bacterium]
MALDPIRRTANIRLSFERHFAPAGLVSVDSIAGNPPAAINLQVPVYSNYAWADPNDDGDPVDPPDPAFITTTWLQDGAGRNSVSLVQVDCWRRTGLPGDAAPDPFGVTAADIADAVEEAFMGMEPGGAFRWAPRVYNFLIDPQNPTETDECLWVQDTGRPNAWGTPSAREIINDDPRMQRVSLTFTVRLRLDGAQMPILSA